ncbi:MAG TPA: hypothetical protein PK122_03130 [Candidatus Paceibacterota bacterium]|nr:hypothetical protein [Candidatus Paceibacterota bacterium]
MANIVQYINYAGSKYPVRISYLAIKKFQEETGKDLAELDEDFSYLETLLWYGLIAGHRAEGKEITIRREDMELVLDESMNEFNQILMTAFPLPGEAKGDTPKKK